MSLLLSKAYLSLEMANRMADKVVSTAKANNFAPITVFVLDSAGSTITQQRMDLCPQVGAEKFAFAKAYTCIATKMSSRSFRDRYCTVKQGETPDPKKYCQMLGMIDIADGKLAPFPGGIILKSRATGEVLGAIGVSGAASDEDELCAMTGAKEYADLIISDPEI